MLASPRANATVLAADSPPPAKEAWQAGHDARSYRVLCQSDSLCVSVIVRAVHQSSSKLGDTPLARLGLAVEPLQQTLQQNRALHRSTSDSHRHAPDVELYSSTALQSALHLYISIYSLQSTALHTLHPLHPPSGKKGFHSTPREPRERHHLVVPVCCERCE